MDYGTLESWVNINSGSANPDGLSKMADALHDRLSQIPATLDRIPLSPVTQLDGSVIKPGDALRLVFRPDAPVQVLFSGHMDTVYGPDHAFQEFALLEDGRAHGPGVCDMKGGLFIMTEAVARYLQRDTSEVVGGTLLITAD